MDLLYALRSKRAQFDFDKDQPWLDTPKPLNFIEETNTLRLEYGHSEVTDSQSGSWVDSSIPYDETPLLGDEDEDRDIRPDEVPIDIRRGSASCQPPAGYSGAFSIAENYGPDSSGTQGVPGSIESRLPVPLDYEVSQQSMTFPVADKEIALYLRRFSDDIAPTFFFGAEAGLNDSLISLGAVHRPVIDAILAAGDRGTPLDQSFRAESESSIEPLGLSRQYTVTFERLLVQALWRFKARVVSNRPWPGMEIIHVQQEPLESSLWFLLQQEIFISATRQEPFSLEMGDLLAQKHNPRLHWPCRLQLHLADVVNFCFGSGDHGHSIFDDLINFSLGWVRLGRYLHSASSFGPSEDGSVFPAVYAVGEGLLMEVQIYHIVRIMLSAHDPALPRLGKRRKDCMRILDVRCSTPCQRRIHSPSSRRPRPKMT